ncbi:MAG TPA: efflux RND transporter permease subunit [Aeromonadales bacterium]|nr:efflux RND transporter permease subunit [Aeromonadales bacterium]
MIAWFAKNSVAANLLMFSMLFVGLMSLNSKIPLEVFPSLDPSIVNVSVTLRSATPSQVEESVVVRIEEAVQDLEGIKQITSASREGSGSVAIEIEDGYSSRDLLADIKSRVDAINTFPVEAERPVVSLVQRKIDVISVAISGTQSEKEIRLMAERVRDDLLAIDGITQVELDSVRPYEIALEFSESALREYGITLQQVADAVNKSSLDVSGGSIKTTGGEILLISKGQAYQGDAYNDIVILAKADGSLVRVRDIATVKDGFTEDALSTEFNGKMAAFVDVKRVGKQSAIEVAQKVRDYIKNNQQNLPAGMKLGYWRDRSVIVINRLDTLFNNAIQGGILVLALLALFLRPSIAIWVFIGIPISFMGAFLVMPYFDVSLNAFSLFAFILVLGVVVDDAIVTGENIYSHLRTSETGLHAVIAGTKEVSVPVTFGVLTTVVAFLPMAFVEGRRGALFAQIPVVIIPILIFSLIESKFVLPSHLKHLKIRKNEESKGRFSQFQQRFADGFENLVKNSYQPFLEWNLKHRFITLSILWGTLLLTIVLILSGWTRFVYFPRVQSEVATATLTMPSGTPFELTDSYVKKITQAAFQLKTKYHIKDSSGEDSSVIMDILSTSGSAGGVNTASNQGRVMMEITPPEKRTLKITSADLVKEWRKMIGVLPGIESLTFRAEIGRGGDPIDIQFSGTNFAELTEITDKVKQELARYPDIFDISDSLSEGKQELAIELNPLAKVSGLKRADVLRQIRAAFFGIEIQRIQRGRDDIRVMVRFPQKERQSLDNLLDMLIMTNDGKQVPLQKMLNFKHNISPTVIRRVDQRRTVDVTADINKKTANMLLIQKKLSRYINDLLSQYPGIKYRFEGESREQRESFASLEWGLVFVLFMIYSLLAIPFKSYSQPFIVLSIIPFGLMGAIFGHWIMGMDLTIFSILGMLALVGVVVNDSLVLVDFVNTHRKKGHAVRQAILQAGSARFRPIILTSLTTFIGLMPLLFEKSTQAQFLKPMAISLGFGILFATVITLIMVPINYLLLDDFKRFLHWLKSRLIRLPQN